MTRGLTGTQLIGTHISRSAFAGAIAAITTIGTTIAITEGRRTMGIIPRQTETSHRAQREPAAAANGNQPPRNERCDHQRPARRAGPQRKATCRRESDISQEWVNEVRRHDTSW